MHIKKIIIENFKCFEGVFALDLNPALNILVGDNEAGKSTIIEAINLVLSWYINWKYLKTELNEALFNNNTVKEYIDSVSTDSPIAPPSILIELYLQIEDEHVNALFEGTGNTLREKDTGIQFRISMNDDYIVEYQSLLEEALRVGDKIASIPIEYYDFWWKSFARDTVSPRSFNKYFRSSLIDSSNNRYPNWSDVYMSRIIRNNLTDAEIISVSQAHRKLKETFSNDKSIIAVNDKIKQEDISEKQVRLDVDVSTKTAWETSLVTYLGDIPFENIGKGEQCLVKTKLALSDRRSQNANVLLIEEPENHLSHTKLNTLIKHIVDHNEHKQIIISTHSSFVANKLGLGSLIFLNVNETTWVRKEFRINKLAPDTHDYFQKLPWYDTLRLILCKKAILVEGDCEELIVQKAYWKTHGKLPIEAGVDVISVRSLAFKRFLDIAKALDQSVIVVTDNDWAFNENITEKYKDYDGYSTIKICADSDESLPTLEPQLVYANKDNLDTLRKVLELDEGEYPDCASISSYMVKKSNKTDCSLRIFDTIEEILFPQYILNAVNS